MRNKKVIILIVLSIFAVISLIYGIVVSPKGRAVKVHTVAAENLPQVSSPELVFSQRRAKRSKFTSWERNPFTLEENKGDTSDLKLSGILWDENNSQAIINEEVLGKGGKIGEFEIIDIQKDKVTLSDGTKKIELKIY